MTASNGVNNTLLIAIPTADGRLCAHFGHCQQFALIEVDRQAKRILESRAVAPPPHEPGLLPKWLHQQGVGLTIAGGMGGRAQQIFASLGIDLIVGAASDPPEQVVQAYLDGKLESGDNLCDH